MIYVAMGVLARLIIIVLGVFIGNIMTFSVMSFISEKGSDEWPKM